VGIQLALAHDLVDPPSTTIAVDGIFVILKALAQ
jgi:hypothetical protein